MKRVWAALLCAASFSACAGAHCPAQLITDPAQALRAQQNASQPIRSLRADAKIDQRGKEGRIKGRILMFVERPDRVRFDAMTQFGPALILTSDGTSFALSDFKDNRYTTGPACAKNLGRVVGVALSSADVASVLLGDAPLIGDASSATQQGLTCGGDGLYKVSRRAADGAREELSFRVAEADLNKPPAEQHLYLAQVSLWDAQGTALYRVRYEDYRKVAQVGASPGPSERGFELPHTVRIDDFVNDSDALLRLSDVAVDVKVPEGAFVQTARAGLKVEEVACDQLQ